MNSSISSSFGDDHPAIARQAKRDVLAGTKRQLHVRLDPDHPEVGCEVTPRRDDG
jgi:hypothetical protein